MQVPVFIVENLSETDDQPAMDIQRNLILLHWGTKEAYFPLVPDNGTLIPFSVTVGICRDPITGQTLTVKPELIYFHADDKIKF